jgi:hypothetical protein
MRYAHGGKGIKGVGGMSKINSAVMNATYLKTRSGIHFKKDQPSESHVLVEAFNTGETESRIWQNTTAIPGTGNFSATSLYSPSTSASGAGVFSMAPDGDVAYCNGEESCIWGGAEREVAGFINYDPDGTFSYDFTEEVRNTKTDSLNIASLTSRSSGQDGNAKLLMHFDNNYTDTIGTHSPNANNTPTFTTSSKFGTHAVVMNGSVGNQYINISDHADFDFSGGTFTIDCWLFKASSDAAYTHTIWYQRTTNDNDSFKFYADENGALIVTIKAGGTKQFSGATDFKTANGVVGADWRHVELVESGNNWYIFVDGELKAYTSDAARAANYTGDVWIGYDGSEYILARLDELRISDSARHTTSFEPLSEAYSTDSTQTAMYIGSVRPLDGFKLYIGTANTSASSMSVFYWDGSTWAAVSSLTDNTDTGASLAQTGTVTFTSTASTAKIKYIDGVLVYWYKVVVDALSAGTTITHVTASAPFQEIVDIWDGMPRPIDSFQIYDASKYSEATINVRENEYNASDAGTFISVPQLATGSDYVICGFIERMTGVVFNFVSATENTVSGTVVSVDYWDGSDWATVGTVDDGTVENNVSWGKTGAMTWDAPASSSEFTQSISNDVKLYYYNHIGDSGPGKNQCL